MFGIQTQSALIAFILLLAVGINVLSQERRVAHRWSFVALVSAMALYNLAFFVFAVAGGQLWWRVLLLAGAAVGLTALSFFRRFLDQSMEPAQTLASLLSLTIAVLVMTHLGDSPWLGGLAASVGVGGFGYGIWRLDGKRRAAESQVEARRLGYLVIGGAVTVVFSALDLLPMIGVPFPSLGHVLSILYLSLLMQVVQRSRLLDLEELISRSLVLMVQALMVALVYTALVVWVGDRLGLFFFNTLVASLVLVFTFDPVSRVLDRWLGRLLFRRSREFEALLHGLRRELANVINLADLVERVLDRLVSSRRVTHASVYLPESGGHAYFRAGAVGPAEMEELGVVRGRGFLEMLRREHVLALEQIESELADAEHASLSFERLSEVHKIMDAMSAGICFALLSGDRLLGWLAVKDERTREAFSSFEIDRIGEITAQITAVIENSELFEQLKERDRLTVIGEMATGMAHEIRNPLGAIKGAGQLLDPKSLDPDERELVQVILEETERLNTVLSQFLDYARPYRGQPAPVRLGPVLDRVATLVRAEEWATPIAVTTVADPALPAAWADADQMRQVILNLARNACEAMSDTGGELTLSAVLQESAAPGRIEVSVRDSGPGIPAENIASLFIPFFTTKRHGTGLGLAICQRLVQQHGSTIRVESTVGRGAVLSFELPLAEEELRLSGEHRRQLAAETP